MPANESTTSGNSAVSGELMLKCSPWPTLSPPIPLRCSSQLEPIGPAATITSSAPMVTAAPPACRPVTPAERSPSRTKSGSTSSPKRCCAHGRIVSSAAFLPP